MALPIATDGQQVLRQLVKDVAYLRRTVGTIQTLNANTGLQEEIVYVSDPNGPPGSVTVGDVPLNDDVQAPGEVPDGDKDTVTEGDKLWLVVPSAPICTTNQQAVTVTWDGFGADGEDIPPNFGVLEIHRSIDEFFDVFDIELAGTTLVGVLTYPGSLVFTNQMYDTAYYYRFIMRAADGRRSGQSEATAGIAELTSASDIDPVVFDDINESIATAQETADNAIASYAPEYAVSASQTVPPTTGWSTTTPVRTPGTYIWYRTTVTYGNGATSTTNPALLTGNDGAAGAPGAPGTPAAVITLTATTQILAVPAGGGATTPTTSVVTGVATNTTITAWLYSVDGAAFSATVPPGVSRTGNVVTITGSTMTAKTIAVRMTDAGTVSDTLTVAKVTDGAGGTPGTPGAPGADGMTILLSNEAQTFAAGTTNAQAGTATTTVIAYKGTVQQTATVGTITGGGTGITAAVTNNGTTAPVVTFTVTTALVTANGTFTIPVTSGGITVNQVFSWSLSFSGAAGAPGAPAAVVTLNATTQVLTSPAGGGATNPTTSVVTGTTANTTITVWEYSVDGAAFSATVPAGTSRTGNVVTITGSTMTAKTLTVRMADAAGIADTMTVAKVSDGATGATGGTGGTGPAGADAYTVLLTNEAQVFPGTVAAAIAGSATTSVLAYKATTAQTATIGTITGQVTGLTTAITNNGTTSPLVTITVTTALTTGGTLTIPVTVGGIVFTKLLSWSVSFAGAPGATGGTGATGVSVTSVTPYFATVTPIGAAAPAIPVVSPPVAPWVATEPTYVPDTELYRTERVLYSNATFQYTTVTKVSSYAAATAAMTAANGRNRVIYSTSPASGTSFNGIPFIDGDTWFQLQGVAPNQTAIAQSRFVTNAWIPQLMDNAIIAANLDAAKITAGYLDVANRIQTGSLNANKIQSDTITALQIAADAVTASEIAANSITAEKIALGVLRRNLIFDGSFEDAYALTNWDPFVSGQGNAAQWRYAVPGSTVIPVRDTTGQRTRSGNSSMVMTVPTGGVSTLISNTFAVTPDLTYRLVVNACSLTALANMVVDIQVGATAADITGFTTATLTGDTSWVLSPPAATEPLDASEFTTYSWTFTPTAGQNFAALRIGNNAPAAASTLVLDDISVILTGVGGASELTAAGLRLFDNNGMEVTALVSNRSNRLSVSGVGNQTLAQVTAAGDASFQNLEVAGQPDLIQIIGSVHANNVVTVYTKTSHGYETGDVIFVNGLSAATNGSYPVLDPSTPTTFTYAKTAAGGGGGGYVAAPEGATVNIGTTLSTGDKVSGLTIYGTEFTDYLDRLPRGLIASAYFNNTDWTSPAVTTQGEIGIAEVSFTQEAGRSYKVVFNGAHISATTARAVALFKLRYTNNGNSPSVIAPLSTIADSVWHEAQPSEATTVPSMQPQGVWGPAGSTIRVLLSWQRYYGTGSLFLRTYGGNTGFQKPFRLYVEDMGVDVVETWNGNYGGNDYTAAAPAAPPVKKTYTTTYTSVNAASYTGQSGIPKDNSQGEQDMKQGYSSYDKDSRSLWLFPVVYNTDWSGATISKVRLYLYANHWYYSSGGTALIKAHGYSTTLPTSNPSMATLVSSANWPKPGGRWVTLPNNTFTFNSVSATLYAHMIAGRVRGFGVGPSGGTNLLYYGRFNKSGAKLEVTYLK